MGFKPWRYLSLLVLAGVVLAGCNSTNPREGQARIETKGPPGSPQAAQRPPAYPGNANQPFPLAKQAAKPSPYAQTSGSTPNLTPATPTTNSPFSQNPGSAVPQQSQSFAPPQLPAFQPMNAGGSIPLPGRVANDPLPKDTTLFPVAPSNNLPAPPPPGFGNFPPQR